MRHLAVGRRRTRAFQTGQASCACQREQMGSDRERHLVGDGAHWWRSHVHPAAVALVGPVVTRLVGDEEVLEEGQAWWGSRALAGSPTWQ